MRKFIPARSFRKAPSNVFIICDESESRTIAQENDSFYVRGWTKDRVDEDVAAKVGIKFIELPGDLVDKLEGWDMSYNTNIVTATGWNFDIAKDEQMNNLTLKWNQGGVHRLFDYMSKHFSGINIVDTDHEYYDQRALVDETFFHKDINDTHKFYKSIESTDSLITYERNQLRDANFNRHVAGLYRLYNVYKAKGWSNNQSIPVFETSDGEYIPLDKCTISCVAGLADIDVQIDIVATGKEPKSKNKTVKNIRSKK